MYRKALVTIDGSPFSLDALEHVANVQAAEAVVLEVTETVPFLLARQVGAVGEISPAIANEITERERAAVEANLAEATKRLRAAGVQNVSTSTREGKAGEEIVRFAREEGCDLVVMSTHGRTGMRRAMLGSVADYVVHNLEGAAVLLVRPPQE